MSLLDRFLKSSAPIAPLRTLEEIQAEAVASFEASCKALRDATKPHDTVAPAQPLWSDWWEKAEKVREAGLDPLDFANAKRGAK